MERSSFERMVEQALEAVPEIAPWDLRDILAAEERPLLLDVREGEEYVTMHIPGSVNVPRGLLEAACDYGFEETLPELVAARDREVVVICRSGRRSALAGLTLQQLGYRRVRSLKLGVRGWHDDGGELADSGGREVDPEEADEFFRPKVSPEQMRPAGR